MNAKNAKNALVKVIKLSRFTLSAITPPNTEKTNKGIDPERDNKPNIKGELVNSCINHNLPDPNAQIPKFENALPIQKIV